MNLIKAQTVNSEWTTDIIVRYLNLDPYQSRISRYPIPLKHPTTGRIKVVAEFAEDVIGDSRFAIETETHLIFVSRVQTNNSSSMFFPTQIFSKEEIKKLQKKD